MRNNISLCAKDGKKRSSKKEKSFIPLKYERNFQLPKISHSAWV